MTNTDQYTLSAKEAAKKLNKSVTTVHRYVRQGKLNANYVDTKHGKEVRLKKSEVDKLADKLNEDKKVLPEGADLPVGDENTQLNIIKLLDRHERTLYQLGQLTEKLDRQKERKQDRIKQLEEKEQRLKSHLHDKAALIEALQSELTRPLSFTERLRGQRFTNH